VTVAVVDGEVIDVHVVTIPWSGLGHFWSGESVSRCIAGAGLRAAAVVRGVVFSAVSLHDSPPALRTQRT